MTLNQLLANGKTLKVIRMQFSTMNLNLMLLDIKPMITYGTNPGMGMAIDGINSDV